MKENIYDNGKFFDKYSKFPRSVEGLKAAGEWSELRRLLPDFTGKRVLDIGCGFGWHCVYAAEQGAYSVLGIDISSRMLEVAREKTCFTNVEYRRIAMEDMEFPADSFDIALSSLAFHYTPDFSEVCRRIRDSLTMGGDFVFSVEHPVFTASGSQEWVCDSNGRREYWPVDNYFFEGKRSAVFLGETVTKYHKTLATYMSALLNMGFAITGIAEPKPDEYMLASQPDMKDELRRPMMLIVSAKKIK